MNNNKSSTNSHYFQINILHILVPLKETPKIIGKSGTKRIINQPNVYFLCVIICRMEIQHRSDQGLSKDHGNSLEFSRAFLFLPLRTRHWPLHPSIPPLKTQRRRRGMQNVNGQTTAAPLERGRTSRCEVWPSSAPLALLIGCQKWNSTRSVQGGQRTNRHGLTPDSEQKRGLQDRKKESANHGRTNETDSIVWWILGIWTTCGLTLCFTYTERM